MFRNHLFVALVAALALPAVAQETCNLQMNVRCTPGPGSTSCTSTTLNAGANVCSGEYISEFFVEGAGKVTGFQNSLGLGECFDSSFFPQPGVSWALCFGTASL